MDSGIVVENLIEKDRQPGAVPLLESEWQEIPINKRFVWPAAKRGLFIMLFLFQLGGLYRGIANAISWSIPLITMGFRGLMYTWICTSLIYLFREMKLIV